MGGLDHAPLIIPSDHLKHENEQGHDKNNTIGNIVKISSQTHPISSDIICQKFLEVSHKYFGYTL